MIAQYIFIMLISVLMQLFLFLPAVNDIYWINWWVGKSFSLIGSKVWNNYW